MERWKDAGDERMEARMDGREIKEWKIGRFEGWIDGWMD
jgi:hypothetical protein